MLRYFLSLGIKCQVPEWINSISWTDSVMGDDPRYRLFLNDDLLIERTWIWKSGAVIKENLIVDLPLATMNNITIVPVKSRFNPCVKFEIVSCNVPVRHPWEVAAGTAPPKPSSMRVVSNLNLLIIT
jgi:hypothetical protein